MVPIFWFSIVINVFNVPFLLSLGSEYSTKQGHSLTPFALRPVSIDSTMDPKTTDNVGVTGISRSSSKDASTAKTYGFKDHWRCLAACTLVSMCPFQYGMPLIQILVQKNSEPVLTRSAPGLDFGLISGLQAMVGFLKVFGYPSIGSCHITCLLTYWSSTRSLDTKTREPLQVGTSRLNDNNSSPHS